MKKIILFSMIALSYFTAQGMQNPHGSAHTPENIITQGSEDEIIQLLENCFDPSTIIEHENASGTVFHWAARRGFVKVFDYIKATNPGADLIMRCHGWTALHIAGAYGMTQIFDWFKANRPDIDLNLPITEGTTLGFTSLHIAAAFGRAQIFDWFKINCPDIDFNHPIAEGRMQGWTPLHIAAKMGKTQIFYWSNINCPAALELRIATGQEQGYTPLHCAAQFDQSQIFDWFKINRPDLSLNPTIKNTRRAGSTPLLLAAEFNHKKIVDLLSASLTNPRQCCFLTFDQNDIHNAIASNLTNSIIMKILSIATPRVLQKTFAQFPLIKDYCESGKFTVLASSPTNLIVIIPESLQELGITIPSSENQKEQPGLDISTITDKYGLKNLHLINPLLINKIVENCPPLKDEQTNELIDLFEAIINNESENHPTCYYLDGHGLPRGKTPDDPGYISSIPLYYMNNLLSCFEKLGTQFLFVNSCYGAGTNLIAMQQTIKEIITKQLADSEQLKKAKKEIYTGKNAVGINYAIVTNATSGIGTYGEGNFNAMFTKLREFLQTPSWALEFDRNDNKPPVTISDVIASFGVQHSHMLPSIRLPDNSGYFRSLDIGNMEIISISKIIEKGYTKIAELLAQSKHPLKAIADEAERKLQKTLAIEYQIKADAKFVQIYPTDLVDFKLVINGSSMPKFISKQPGASQHYIQTITFKSNAKDAATACKEFINDGFANVFDPESPSAELPKCWFIQSVELTAEGKKSIIRKLAIMLLPAPRGYTTSYVYTNENGEVIFSDGQTEIKYDKLFTEFAIANGLDPKEFIKSNLNLWFKITKPLQETLTEATGGMEITAEEKIKFAEGKSSNSRLINPQFQRTSEDLFNQFMAEN